LLILLAIVTGLIGIMITGACWQQMELSLSILDARAAGRHTMVCGPPMSVLVLPVAYLMSSLAVVVGLGAFFAWLLRQVSDAPRALN
jgi:hypothetical protein